MKKNTRVGAVVDRYARAREARLKADRRVAELKAVETRRKAEVMDVLQAEELEVGGGKLATVRLVPRAVYHPHWPQVWEYIRKHDAFELLQRRLNESAVRERIEDGEDVGVETDSILHLTYSARKSARKAK